MKAKFVFSAAAFALNLAPLGHVAVNAAETATFASNPRKNLLTDWQGPYDGVPPWDQVKPELFPEAIQFAIDEQQREIAAIINNPEEPTFENTVEALEKTGARLGRVAAILEIMASNMASKEYEKLYAEWKPNITEAYNEVFSSKDLFSRVMAIYTKRSALKDATKVRLIEEIYRDFAEKKTNIPDKDRQVASDYDRMLEEAYLKFNNKMREHQSRYNVALEVELAGLPEDVRFAASEAAKKHNLPDGQFAIVNKDWIVSSVLRFADDRSLRERVWKLRFGVGQPDNMDDAYAIADEIVRLRTLRAKLLGYTTYAEMRMQGLVIKTPQQATELAMKLWPLAVKKMREKIRKQQEKAAELGHHIKIEPWDYEYYQEKVRQSRYSFSKNKVVSYFEFTNLLQGAFWTAEQLYDLSFKENTGSLPVWHSDVKTYEVTDKRSGSVVGLLYVDYLARDNKRPGAWQLTQRARSGLLGHKVAIASIAFNAKRPGIGEPVLLGPNLAEALFHEVGHALHEFVRNAYYPTLAEEPFDFSEYAGRINEQWLLTDEVKGKFIRHYENGEPMSDEMAEYVIEEELDYEFDRLVSQIFTTIYDIKLHNCDCDVIDVREVEKQVFTDLDVPNEIIYAHRYNSDSLFVTDYFAKGFHTALLTDIVTEDIWKAFEETGDLWHKPTADRFRNYLLSTGNAIDRAEAYRAFRGRDLDVKGLLEKRGIAVN